MARKDVLTIVVSLAVYLAAQVLLNMPTADGAPCYRTAKVTSYCSKCKDGGFTKEAAYKFKKGTVAADFRYHKRGEKVIIDGKCYVVNNTGGAIRGRDRFDVCQGQPSYCRCRYFGVKQLKYYVVK